MATSHVREGELCRERPELRSATGIEFNGDAAGVLVDGGDLEAQVAELGQEGLEVGKQGGSHVNEQIMGSEGSDQILQKDQKGPGRNICVGSTTGQPSELTCLQGQKQRIAAKDCR